MADFDNNGVFGWDDEVDEAKYSLLPEGDYRFTVKTLERGRYEPKDPSKGPSCDQANLTLSVVGDDVDGNPITATIFHSLRLRTKETNFIRVFFDSIGLASAKEKRVMPWGKIVGETGVCRIQIHEYNGKESNRVQYFYERAKAPKKGMNFNDVGEGSTDSALPFSL